VCINTAVIVHLHHRNSASRGWANLPDVAESDAQEPVTYWHLPQTSTQEIKH